MKVQMMDPDGVTHVLGDVDIDVLADLIESVRTWAVRWADQDFEGPHRVELVLEYEGPVVQLVVT
jgi:hypothetical protein